MSINLSGTLTVQVIQGRRGPFKTAKLATSIGTFDVKNPILKQISLSHDISPKKQGIYQSQRGQYIPKGLSCGFHGSRTDLEALKAG